MQATKPSLIRAALETFLRFLNWIPLGVCRDAGSPIDVAGYIFETDIIDQLVNRYLEPPEFRNVTLKCLSEIGALQIVSRARSIRSLTARVRSTTSDS